MLNVGFFFQLANVTTFLPHTEVNTCSKAEPGGRGSGDESLEKAQEATQQGQGSLYPQPGLSFPVH